MNVYQFTYLFYVIIHSFVAENGQCTEKHYAYVILHLSFSCVVIFKCIANPNFTIV